MPPIAPRVPARPHRIRAAGAFSWNWPFLSIIRGRATENLSRQVRQVPPTAPRRGLTGSSWCSWCSWRTWRYFAYLARNSLSRSATELGASPPPAPPTARPALWVRAFERQGHIRGMVPLVELEVRLGLAQIVEHPLLADPL